MTKPLTITLFLLSLAAPAVAQNSYQPLATGDVRTYENSSTFGALQDERTEVVAESGIWARFDSFLGQQDQWVTLYRDALYLWDAGDSKVVKLFDFTASVGDSWAVDFSGQFGAGGSMRLAATDETVVVDAGTFDDCYRFAFTTPPGVADAGWGSIWFAPGVGVVKWNQQSFAGPVTHALKSAEIGGVRYPQPVATGGLSVSLQMDRYEYEFPAMAPVANIYATATLTIVNATGTPIDVTYSSGQTFDIELIDSSGNTVWRWSNGRAFTMALRSGQINGTFEVRDSIPLTARDEDYTVRMHLTTMNNRPFSASAAIRVRVR